MAWIGTGICVAIFQGASGESRHHTHRLLLGKAGDVYSRRVQVFVIKVGDPIYMANQVILVVEDNEKNLKLARDLLTFNGYQVLEATTAEEGLEVARSKRPALILMDIELPGMDGITALHQLRADPATEKILVLAVTASAMLSDRQKILDAGFDGYQPKPIRIREFVEEVKRILGAPLTKEESG